MIEGLGVGPSSLWTTDFGSAWRTSWNDWGPGIFDYLCSASSNRQNATGLMPQRDRNKLRMVIASKPGLITTCLKSADCRG
jgi:hypothetical protein